MPPMYHLADGLILAIGHEETSLLDLKGDRQIEVDEQYITAAEQVALGWEPTAHQELIPELLADKIIAEGPMVVDPILHQMLRQMDQMYLPSFEASLSPRARRAYERVLEVHARRKRFQVTVGQCSVLPECALRRAMLVGDAEDVGRKHVLCIGDDDLVSVALTELGHRVTVFDIDDYLIDLFDIINQELNLDIQVEQVDLRDPVGDHEPFDIFLTDPMSNRDCFEVFLSRAFAMLKEGGHGYVAVFAPASRLFQQVADEMHAPIRGWHRRHNRYYSPYMKVHWYESDWVALERTAETTWRYPAEQMCAPLNFYREDYFLRKAALLSIYDRIEEPRFARPLFLDVLLDTLEDSAEIVLENRQIFAEQDWSLVTAGLADGHFTLHVDRDRSQIIIEMYPFDQTLADRLRNLLMMAYKSSGTTLHASVVRGVWDVRFM